MAPGRRPATTPPGEGRRSRPEIESEYPPPASQSVRDDVARERARQAHALADEAHDLARHVASELQELHELRRLFGGPPSPGVQGSGVVGAVVQIQARQEAMEAKIDRLLARPPSEPPRRPLRPAAVVALVAALGGAGGIVAIVSAVRGSAPPAHTPAGGAP